MYKAALRGGLAAAATRHNVELTHLGWEPFPWLLRCTVKLVDFVHVCVRGEGHYVTRLTYRVRRTGLCRVLHCDQLIPSLSFSFSEPLSARRAQLHDARAEAARSSGRLADEADALGARCRELGAALDAAEQRCRQQAAERSELESRCGDWRVIAFC